MGRVGLKAKAIPLSLKLVVNILLVKIINLRMNEFK